MKRAKYLNLILGASLLSPITTTLTSCSKLPCYINCKVIVDPKIYRCTDPQTWSLNDPYILDPVYGSFHVNIYNFDGSTIPYICVDEYVNYWLNEVAGGDYGYGNTYTSVTKDRKTTIVNNYYSKYNYDKAKCVIDYDKQQIIFDDYDCFVNDAYDQKAVDPLATGACGSIEDVYFRDVTHDYHCNSKKFVIDLSYYDIDMFYDLKNNKGFMPYYVFSTMLQTNPLIYMFFDGSNFYEIPTYYGWSNNDAMIAFEYTFRNHKPDILNKEYMEFVYNLLALTLDFKFGLRQRPSRGRPGKIIKYLEHGAYNALKPYHDDIVSLDPNVSNIALRKFFNNECDDGGHARYLTVNLLSTVDPTSIGRGIETAHTLDTQTLLKDAREKAGHTPPINNKVGQIEIVDDGDNGKIAWATLTAFSGKYSEVSYNDVSETNYAEDAISWTMYLDKVIRNPSNNIKKVVLDLSINGGGSVWVEHFISSYLCGRTNPYNMVGTNPEVDYNKNHGMSQTICDPITKSYSHYTVYANVNNNDNVVDDKDCLPSGIELWCITSNFSFSCANMLSCHLSECSDCKFIGDTTGGGACYVDQCVNMGVGNGYRGSSVFHILKNVSTLDKPVSLEEGVTPENYIANTPWNAYKFYDRDYLIENYIH